MSELPRRKKFIDSHVQGALARRLLLQWLAFVTIAGLSSLILQFCANPFLPLAEHIHNLYWSHGPLLISIVFLLPVFVFDTIKLSHRFVGPIARLRVTMQATASSGVPEKLNFRGNDFWQEVAEDYNTMLESLTHKQTATLDAADKESFAATEEPEEVNAVLANY